MHEKEAGIIAQAGEPGAVTVATNMAGRGVDIVLGGKEPSNGDKKELAEWQQKHNRVVELGGLHVIGTERHEARRIDNQLRGRSGRQGDPGSSRFYVSLDDNTVSRFGGDRIKGIMNWAGMDENTPIENRLVSRAIEGAQTRVEGYHFDMRKHLVEYDDVINKQREIIYGERRKILGGADLKANILSMVEKEIEGAVASHLAEPEDERNLEGLISDVATILPLPTEVNTQALSQMKPEDIEETLIKQAEAAYEQKEKEVGPDNMRVVERLMMLRTIDSLWVEHLTMMDYMRQGVGLQAMAQRDPLVAYKRQSHEMFQNLLATIQHDVAHTIYRVGIKKGAVPGAAPTMAAVAAGGAGGGRQRPLKVAGKKIGRNDPCPCGSGKKYKKCCGR
jgi:preprotein translocase subunit SecA